MPEDIQRNISVDVANGKVVYKNHQSQRFSPEDFVDVYNDTVNQYNMLHQQHESLQNDIEDILNSNEDAMQALHKIIEEEPQGGEPVKQDAISVDDINAYTDLKEKRQQKDQLSNQMAQIKNQIAEMRPAAEQAADNPGEELAETEDDIGKEEEEIQLD